MNEELTLFWLLIIGATLALVLVAILLRVSKKQPALRSVAGYSAMPKIVSAAIETARPTHFSIGSAAVGQPSTLSAIASLAIIYEMVQRQAINNQVPLLTLSDPVSLAIAQDTLRRAYLVRQNKAAYRPTAAAWYPQGVRSLAFAAGAASHGVDVKAGSSILLGEFGAEIAYLGEASARHDQFLIAQSTRLEGQAIAYAQADAPLIGEELFVGGAYTAPHKTFEMASALTLDILRWVAVGAIIWLALSNA